MIIIESKRKKPETILKKYPDAILADVTSGAKDGLVKLSPFYPNGGIPVPFSEGYTATCVEAIWQGLKVFEGCDVDVEMFQNDKINVPILGLIENMAWFTPAELPQNRYYIFGKDGGKALAEELQIPLLAQIPLVQSIREGGDSGEPIALQTGHPAASAFDEIAAKITNHKS